VATYTTFPLPGPFLGALDVSGGSSFGDVPVQALWYVGGRGTVRGISAEERVSGQAFWTARAEIGNQLPAARLVLFGDAGWAGSRDAISTDPSLISAGVGVSFLDGLIRADLTKALRGGSGLGLQLYVDAPL
jgi:hemolysin activation/secretion protein